MRRDSTRLTLGISGFGVFAVVLFMVLLVARPSAGSSGVILFWVMAVIGFTSIAFRRRRRQLIAEHGRRSGMTGNSPGSTVPPPPVPFPQTGAPPPPAAHQSMAPPPPPVTYPPTAWPARQEPGAAGPDVSASAAGPAAPTLGEQDRALLALGWQHLRSGVDALQDALMAGDTGAVSAACADLMALVEQIHGVLPDSGAEEVRTLAGTLQDATDLVTGLPEAEPQEQELRSGVLWRLLDREPPR